jgi:hypothetical protein
LMFFLGDSACDTFIKFDFFELHDRIFFHELVCFWDFILRCLMRLNWRYVSNFEMGLDPIISSLLEVHG